MVDDDLIWTKVNGKFFAHMGYRSKTRKQL